MRTGRITFPPSRQWVSRKAPMRPLTPGAPARRRSLGIIWVCDVGDPIRIGWVGVHDPSGLLKKLLQPGSARAADVPANAAAIEPITTATANPGLVNPGLVNSSLMAKPSPPSLSSLERVGGTLRFHCETHTTGPLCYLLQAETPASLPRLLLLTAKFRRWCRRRRSDWRP
jgi:hypothetical protein